MFIIWPNKKATEQINKQFYLLPCAGSSIKLAFFCHCYTSPLFSQLHLLKLHDYIKFQTLYFMYQFEAGKVPSNFDSFFIKTSSMHNVRTRFATRSSFYLPKIRTNYGKFNIRYNGPKLWNELDENFKSLSSNTFKKELTSYFIDLY